MVSRTKEQLIDDLLQDYRGPESLWGETGLFDLLRKKIVERDIDTEISDDFLSYFKHYSMEQHDNNNSHSSGGKKTIAANPEQVTVKVPQAGGFFEFEAIPGGVEKRILGLYSRGMSIPEIQACLRDIHKAEVTQEFITTVTDDVLQQVKTWQSRPLDKIFPIVFMHSVAVKSREKSKVVNRSLYLAFGITMEGRKEHLGIWIAHNDAAKFWRGVATELKVRGVKDIFVTCIDSLKGSREAFESVFPRTRIQLCLIHLISNSIKYVDWTDRKRVGQDLKTIYASATDQEAKIALDAFGRKWDAQYPAISPMWQKNWKHITPVFDYPEDIRKVICAPDATEPFKRSLHKVVKTAGVFPDDGAVLKIFYLALANIAKTRRDPLPQWKSALRQFAIMFAGRVEL